MSSKQEQVLVLDEGNTDSGKKGIEGKSTNPLLSHACMHPLNNGIILSRKIKHCHKLSSAGGWGETESGCPEAYGIGYRSSRINDS